MGRGSRTAVTEAVLNGAIWRQRLDDTFELVWPDRMVTADEYQVVTAIEE